jgi:hypothetical protein
MCIWPRVAGVEEEGGGGDDLLQEMVHFEFASALTAARQARTLKSTLYIDFYIVNMLGL